MSGLTRRWLGVALIAAACIALGAPTGAAAKASRVTGQVFADNDFELYVNGKLVASDPVDFTPFNVVKVKFRATYPMTFAVRAKDFADPVTGLEYNNTKTGDGGMIAAFSNGVVTNGSWSEFTTFRGPTNLSQCLASPPTCVVENHAEPAGWQQRSFKASWSKASLFTRQQVGSAPQDYDSYDWGAARFVWGPDLVLDNTVLLRKVVKHPPR